MMQRFTNMHLYEKYSNRNFNKSINTSLQYVYKKSFIGKSKVNKNKANILKMCARKDMCINHCDQYDIDTCHQYISDPEIKTPL